MTRQAYRLQLSTERLTGLPQEEGFQSDSMKRGADLEPAAFGLYEAYTGNVLQRVGFLSMTEYLAGCSPDGYVGDFVGLVGFKCPNSTTHVDYLRRNRLPPEYVSQATHEMWVVDTAQWYDFVSYDDRLPDGLDFFRVRIMRKEFDIAGYEADLLRFLADVAEDMALLERLRQRNTAKVAA